MSSDSKQPSGDPLITFHKLEVNWRILHGCEVFRMNGCRVDAPNHPKCLV